jgi:hypothetical protein
MKISAVCSLALVVAGFVAGCGSAGEPVGSSSEGVSSTPAPVAVEPVCPKNEQLCKVGNLQTGECTLECVPDNVLCVAPPSCNHIVCDPLGKAPRPGCQWSEQVCEWECPVCDPDGPEPRPGCSWDINTCVWDCPVCDPDGPPPEGGCQWETKTCTWLCV